MLAIGELETISALARLEGEGVVLRGRFTPDLAWRLPGKGSAEEFCDRRLLARIHRYTLDRLRSEIEPVSAQDFMRYLLQRQHLGGTRRLEGKRGVLDAIAQLQGFEIPAVAWERDVLPQRVADYNPQWLDDLCLAGDVAWVRLAPKKANGASRGVVGIAGDADYAGAAPRPAVAARCGTRRRTARGADHGRGERGVRRAEGARRAVLRRPRRRDAHAAGAARRSAVGPRRARAGDGGRLRAAAADHDAEARIARAPARTQRAAGGGAAGPLVARAALRHAGARRTNWPSARAMQLLARYGVVFRDLVAREHLGVPWRDIVRALRRQEARGVVRGGRFVAGFVGEQYALPEAVDALRRVRRSERDGEMVRVNAADPLNLAGVITPGARVAALHSNAVTFRDGLPVAIEEGRSVRSLEGDASDALAAIAASD